VRSPLEVETLLQSCDAVVHAASIYSLDTRDSTAIRDTNVIGTRQVIETAWRLGLDPIIHVSSVAAFIPAESPVRPDSPPASRSGGVYGASKAETEALDRPHRRCRAQRSPRRLCCSPRRPVARPRGRWSYLGRGTRPQRHAPPRQRLAGTRGPRSRPPPEVARRRLRPGRRRWRRAHRPRCDGDQRARDRQLRVVGGYHLTGRRQPLRPGSDLDELEMLLEFHSSEEDA